MQLCDETGLMRIAVALREALVNAIYHGNLDLTLAAARGGPGLVRRTGRAAPARGAFADRRVHVTARETRTEATYVIRDEGRGFDPAALLRSDLAPEPRSRAPAAGLFLIRTFMDEVRHNDVGNEITMVKRRDR